MEKKVPLDIHKEDKTEWKPFFQKKPLGSVDLFHTFAYLDSDIPLQDFHWHSSIELLYVIQGGTWVSVDGEVYRLRPRDIVVINSGFIHGFWDVAPDTIIGIIEARPELFEELQKEFHEPVFWHLVFGKSLIRPEDMGGGIHARLEPIFLAVRNENLRRTKGWRLAIKAKIYEIVLILLRSLPDKDALYEKTLANRGARHEILEQIFLYIHNQYNDPSLSLDKTAKELSFSKFYFTRFFKSNTGQTFHSYLSRVRLSYAKAYILESNLTMLDIAMRCGFGSKETFNRVFKHYTGLTPSLYRAEKSKQPVPVQGNF